MEYLLLAIATLGISLQDLMRKFTNSKYKDPEGAPAAFNFLMTAASLCLFTLLSLIGGFQFHLPTLIYALIFGTGFAVAVYFNYQAVRLGPLSLTSLFIAYSLIIPTLSGILFLSEPFRLTSAAGIGLLLISLLLINGRTDKNSAPITKKWVIVVLLAFLGNGLCSLMPKLHQAAYPGLYRTEFMTFGMVLVTTVFLISFLRQKAARTLTRSFLLPAATAGLANGAVNLLVLVLASQLPAALMYPMISAGGIVITFFLSRFVFHERLSKVQLIGFGVGILSIVALNL